MTQALRPGPVTQSRVVQRFPALASAAGAVTRAWCVAEFGVANDMAGRDLKGLTEPGLLQRQGRGRAVRCVRSAGKPSDANRP